MTAARSDYVLQVTDLVDRPGASRQVDLRLPAPGDLDLPLASADEPLGLRGVVESVVEGLLVRGELATTLELACSRCLQPIRREVVSDVVELFSDPADVDPDDEVEAGYEIVDGTIDLGTLVRDALSSAVPLQPLCREDCKGLCPDCGANHNETTCDCSDAPVETRWEALRGLQLPQSRPDDR